MITISKSPNFNNMPWLPLYSKTQDFGNPIRLSSNRNLSKYFLRIILKRFHKLLSSENLMYLSPSLSPPPFFLLAAPLLKPQQFNCILWTTTKAQNNIKIMPHSSMPLKVAEVGNLENIICDLNEVTRRMHQNKTSSEQQPQQKLAVLKLQFQSQNLSRTTTSIKLVGVEVIRSNIKNLPRTTTSTKLGGVEAIHIPISLPIPSVTGPPRKQTNLDD